MICSPDAVSGLKEGGDYMPARGPLREPLRSLVEVEQRVVLLGTGSPEVRYAVIPHLRPTPAPTRKTALASARFGLHVEGGTVCVRDGYDPMKWTTRVPLRQTFPVADGYYGVTALSMPPERGAEMMILLSFERRARRLAGDGWPYLGYRTSR
jgi:hypothetical protein